MSDTQHSLPEIMPVHEMWSLVKGEDKNWGIPGYEVPRKYFDQRNVKWWRDFQASKPKWPIKDKDGNVVVTKRENYLDQVSCDTDTDFLLCRFTSGLTLTMTKKRQKESWKN